MSESGQGGAGRREVAWRLFAAEFRDAEFSYSESDEERAPNYVVTPTGARVNRLFVVGVLTEVEQVGDDVLRARVVDPTGAFVVYAGQYQPDEMAFLEQARTPSFVAVTGKARTFQPDDSDIVYTSIRPESINEVDAETRDRWTVATAKHTFDRASTFADALDTDLRGDELRAALEANGVDDGLAAGIPLALDHYGTTREYLVSVWDVATGATRVVAGEADEVEATTVAPDKGENAANLPGEYALAEQSGDLDAAASSATDGEADAEEPADAAPDDTDTDTDTDTDDDETEAEAEAEAAADSDSDSTGFEGAADSGRGTESEPPAESQSERGSTDSVAAESTDSTTVDATDSAATDATGDAAESDDLGDFGDTGSDDLGDFGEPAADEPATDESAAESDSEASAAVDGDEMYEFDEEEREQVREEHGLEFSTGTEVSDPGEAGIETPEGDAGAEADSDAAAEPESETDAESELEPDPESDSEPESDFEPEGEAGAPSAQDAEPEPPTDGDDAADGDDAPENLENAVMQRMKSLNDGDGVERETLMAVMVDSYDVSPADVEDAIQGALMAGRCYESGADVLKPI